MSLQIRSGGLFRDGSPSVNVNGTWNDVSTVHVNKNGTWRESYVGFVITHRLTVGYINHSNGQNWGFSRGGNSGEWGNLVPNTLPGTSYLITRMNYFRGYGLNGNVFAITMNAVSTQPIPGLDGKQWLVTLEDGVSAIATCAPFVIFGTYSYLISFADGLTDIFNLAGNNGNTLNFEIKEL